MRNLTNIVFFFLELFKAYKGIVSWLKFCHAIPEIWICQYLYLNIHMLRNIFLLLLIYFELISNFSFIYIYKIYKRLPFGVIELSWPFNCLGRTTNSLGSLEILWIFFVHHHNIIPDLNHCLARWRAIVRNINLICRK